MLFRSFVNTGLEDGRFVDFMIEFDRNLKDKKIDGVSFEELCINPKTGGTRSTKDKSIVISKIELLEKIMLEYLHIESNNDEQIDEESIISEMVDIDKEVLKEDMDLYIETLDGEHGLKEECIKVGSKLLDEKNRLSLLAMVAYSYKEGVELDDWMREYAANNNTYFVDQKKNYMYMLNDFNSYRKKVGAA